AADPTITAIAARYEPLAPGQLTPQLIVDQYLTQKQPDGSTVDYVARAQERLHRNLLRAGAALGIAAAFLLWLGFRARDRGVRGWPIAVCILLTAAELLAFGVPLNRGRALPYRLDGPVHEFLRAQRDHHGSTG